MNIEIILILINFLACSVTAGIVVAIFVAVIHQSSIWLRASLALIVLGKMFKALLMFEQTLTLEYLIGTTTLSIGFTCLFIWVIWFHKYHLKKWPS